MKGIVAGALGGLGKAGSELADKYIEKEQQLNLEQERSKILEAREFSIARRKQQIGREDDAYAWKMEQERAPLKREMRAADYDATIANATRNLDDQTKLWRTEAQAKHIPSPNSDLQRAVYQGQLDDAKIKRDAVAEEAALKKSYRDLRQTMVDAENSGDENAIVQARRTLDNFERANGLKPKTETLTAKDEGALIMQEISKLSAELSSAYGERKTSIQRRIDELRERIDTLRGASSSVRTPPPPPPTDTAGRGNPTSSTSLPPPGSTVPISRVREDARNRGISEREAIKLIEAEGHKVVPDPESKMVSRIPR